MMKTTGGTICPLCGSTIPLGTGHGCSKVVLTDPFPCPSCAVHVAREKELDRLKIKLNVEIPYLRDENAALRAEVERLEDEHRHICGELGEFYAKQKRGSTAIEKIRFFRKDYDERIEAFRENIDSIKQGMEERMGKRDEVWREKVKMLENDLGVAWKRIAELEITFYAIPGTLEGRGMSAVQDNLTFIRKETTE